MDILDGCKEVRVRTGSVLTKGMYMEILAKEMCICVQKESVSKSLRKTSQERGAAEAE